VDAVQRQVRMPRVAVVYTPDFAFSRIYEGTNRIQRAVDCHGCCSADSRRDRTSVRYRRSAILVELRCAPRAHAGQADISSRNRPGRNRSVCSPSSVQGMLMLSAHV
jgi:hypothetical protein